MELDDKFKSIIQSTVLLNMATLEPDLVISGFTNTDDLIDLLENGKTELYSAERVARIIHDVVIGILEKV